MPRKTFVAGDVLQASEVNTFLMNQSVMTFASESARNTAITLPVDGMVTYLEDTKTYQTYNGTAWVTINQINSFSDVPGVSLSTPTAGQKLVFDGTNWVNLTGYVYVETVYFTSSGTFTKASYPWLRAVRVKCVGGGGGGGGLSSVSGSDLAASGAGAGGNYAESFITDIAGLSASVTVTRGAGGAGRSGNNTGFAGGTTSFGALVQAGGGGGGAGDAGGSNTNSAGGGSPSGTLTGDITVEGQHGSPGYRYSSTVIRFGGNGGSSGMGMGAGRPNNNIASGDGVSGRLYGGGGSGTNSIGSSVARTGGDGANGIVVVELYA
jgi:hypothetical protein